MIDFLSAHKNAVLVVLVFAAVLNSFRFYGDWESFLGIVFVQLWFARGVYKFLAGGVIHIAPGRVLPDADPAFRNFIGLFVFLLYVFVFFW
jgi:hypothetical protein